MIKVFLLCGPPGSGKSTWAKARVEEEKPHSILISRDDVRFSLLEDGDDYFAKEDDVYFQWVQEIQAALSSMKYDNIYIDATHLSEKARTRTLDSLLFLETCEIYAVNCAVPLEICLEQNDRREGRAKVPRSVVKRMFYSYKPPTHNEKYEYKEIFNPYYTPKIWFTSDLHFCHNRDFLYAPRGFESVEEMNAAIVKNWNELVDPRDTVYILGDIMLNDNDEGIRLLSILNGNLVIIRGNHDTDYRVELYEDTDNVIAARNYASVFKYKGYTFYLSHYPTLTENYDDDAPLKTKVFNLYGHTHQKEKFFENNSYLYHVGMDSHNCCPVLIDDIIKDIKERNGR